MKIILILLFTVAFSFTGAAQGEKTRAKYRIKVVEKNYVVTRGIFYAAADDGLTLITGEGDTVKLAANKISSLFIRKRGIIAPLIIVTAGVLGFLALQIPEGYYVDPESLAVVAAVLGASIGYVAGELFSSKKYYKKLEAKDFPLIKANLQKYTQIK